MVALQEDLIDPGVLERFDALNASGRLAHAYLFVGPRGVGKSETALAVARLVNCERPAQGRPCGECPSCLKINAATHPDVHRIEKLQDKESISIEQVRGLIGQSQLRPYEGRRKVFIIKDIEGLTPEGSNSLLKTLEEPSPSSLLLLTTSVPEKCLETVKSRCHPVLMHPLPVRKLAQILKKDYAIKDPQAQCLAAMAGGCPAIARKLHENGFLKRKNAAIDELLFGGGNEAYWKKVLGDKGELREALQVLLGLLRDMLLLKAGMPESGLLHADRAEELRQWASRYSFVDLAELVRETVEATRTLEENLNVKIAFALIREKLLSPVASKR